MSNPWTNDIRDEDEELAELMAEVIARKTQRAAYRDFLLFGPGRVVDVELNQEKIYET